MEDTIVDLHCHCSDSYGFIWNVPRLKEKSYSPTDIPKRLLMHSLSFDRNTLAGIINFGDVRGLSERRGFDIIEKITRLRAGDVGAEQLVFDYKTSLLSVHARVKGKDIVASYIIGEECETDKGHILVVGLNDNLTAGNVRDAVKEAKEEHNALVFVDHFGAEPGRLVRAIYPIVGGNQRISLGREELADPEIRRYLDGMEVWNGNFGESLEYEQACAAVEFGLPGIVTSDSHSIDDIYKSHMRMPLDARKAIDAVKEDIMKGIKETRDFQKAMNSAGGLRHILGLGIALAGITTGVLKRTV